jgi:hypothetical protein
VIFGAKATFPSGLEFDVPLSAFTRFGRVAWISVEPVEGVLQPYVIQTCIYLPPASCCRLVCSAGHFGNHYIIGLD